ncbi:MAG: hypothetical protein KME32_01140 [Mojavia pulchra JT2-VF2]|uniref:Uncharacterized protein n=1 Tax=Mojavia pulchra JT2-VF2 TaxID=287848 RepID=A0A951PVG5_9NOST|nr:hypothetical protein [Mojavia pulchra JT2-VF2]
MWQNITKSNAAFALAATFVMLLVVNYGCVKKAQEETQLEIKNIKPILSNNLYKINGSTNLPESSRITVAAVRYLRPTQGQQEPLQSSNTSNKRSILARQIVQVKQGKWQADLNLWQVAPDGRFEEVWQANQSQMGVIPENTVTFIATFDPAGQWEESGHQNSENLKPENYKLEGKLVRFTNEGEKYVQVSQSLLIPLPVGKTVPPRPQPEDINAGWGNRYQILPESTATRPIMIPPAKSRQTNASPITSEFLR